MNVDVKENLCFSSRISEKVVTREVTRGTPPGIEVTARGMHRFWVMAARQVCGGRGLVSKGSWGPSLSGLWGPVLRKQKINREKKTPVS